MLIDGNFPFFRHGFRGHMGMHEGMHGNDAQPNAPAPQGGMEFGGMPFDGPVTSSNRVELTAGRRRPAVSSTLES